MKRLLNSFTFRIAAPVVVLVVLLGLALDQSLLAAINNFAHREIRRDLKNISHEIFDLCNNQFEQLMLSGKMNQRGELVITKAIALGKIEDHFRQKGITGIVYQRESDELLLNIPGEFSSDTLISKVHLPGRLVSLEGPKGRFFAYAVDFPPWQWRIVAVKSQAEYADLIDNARRLNRYTLLLLTVVALAMVILLHRAVQRPIQTIVNSIKEGQRPDYHGVDVFQFLSSSIADMMEALKQSEERYRRLVENLPYGLFISEVPDANFLFANRQMGVIFGYDQQELARLTLWDLVMPAEHGKLREHLAQALETQGTKSCKHTGRRRDGSSLRFEVTLAAMEYDGQRAVQGFLHDITAQEVLEQQLLQAQKMEAVGTLAGGVAHEFNNILMAIRGYTQLLAGHSDLDRGLRGYLDKIDRHTQRAAELIRSMLNFSRLERGEARPVEINRVIYDMMDLLRRTLPPEVRITLELADELPPVMANANQLEQVFINLVLNARDAMPSGGQVTFRSRLVSSRDQGGKPCWVEITVQDNGQGMDEQVLKHIFEPFFTTKAPGKGTGLGLSVVYSIIKQHGGKIQVESRPGQGSSFRILLPVEDRQEDFSQAPPCRDAAPAAKGEEILVVDDEEAVREITREALESFGYRVTLACQGKEAVELYRRSLERKHPYHLVIMDLTMPVMDGLAASRRILKLDPQARIVVASGQNRPQEQDLELRSHLAGVLRKPFDLKKLLEAVTSALAGGEKV